MGAQLLHKALWHILVLELSSPAIFDRTERPGYSKSFFGLVGQLVVSWSLFSAN